MLQKLRYLSFWEWLVCALGMFFVGLGVGYIDVRVMDYEIGFLFLD